MKLSAKLWTDPAARDRVYPRAEANPATWCSLQLAVAVLPLGFGVSGRGEQEKQQHRQGCGLAVAGCCCSPTASGLPLPSQIPTCAT